MTSLTDVIREKAQKYNLEEIVQRIDASLDAIGQHLNGLRQDQADFKPGATEWSVGEIIHHAADATRGMVHVSDKLNRNEEFKRPMSMSDAGLTKSGVSVDTLRDYWETMRRDLRAKLATLTPPLNTAATRSHPTMGPLNAMEWLVVSYLHNHRHQDQIVRVKSAADYPK